MGLFLSVLIIFSNLDNSFFSNKASSIQLKTTKLKRKREQQQQQHHG